jgi:hypothetical protein
MLAGCIAKARVRRLEVTTKFCCNEIESRWVGTT